MVNRIEPKQAIQEPDVQLLASFGGLSSASLNNTGEVVYFDKLVNAVVNKSGELQQRIGSECRNALIWYTDATAFEVYNFLFDGLSYALVRVGVQIAIVQLDKTTNYYNYVAYKNDIFRVQSQNEPATYTTVIEGNYCHVLIATASTQLLMITITSRQGIVISKPISTRVQFNIQDYPVNNSINTSKAALYTVDNKYIQPVSVSQSSALITYDASSVSLSNVNVGTRVKLHAYYWLRCCDANYYAGLSLYNTAIRRNSLPLDVNVQIPQELVDNSIINEPDVQDLSIRTTEIFKTNGVSANEFVRVTNRQPTTVDQFDFADGGYIVASNVFTNRTPAFVAFGGLESGGAVTRVFICRLRRLLLANREAAYADIKLAVDGTLTQMNSYDAGFTVINPTIPAYFSFANRNVGTGVSNNPGVGLSAVVELIYTSVGSSNNGSTELVNLQPTINSTISLDDGYCVPLYGYNAFANTKDHKYPNIVTSVGNRIILTGLDNKITVSSADWNYRGISFNNMQVTSFGFSAASAYTIKLGQQSSVVKAITSINGVLLAASDTGIFRISGSNPTSPPTAEQANVSRVSNELLNNNETFAIFDNKIYYSSRNGFFQLQYDREVDELANKSLSVNVNNWFKSYATNTIVFSDKHRAFLISFAGTNKILAYSIDSATWSTFAYAFDLPIYLNKTLDGFVIKTKDSGNNNTIVIVEHTDNTTEDIRLFNFLGLAPIPPLAVAVTENITDVSKLVCPAELAPLLAPNSKLLLAYGDESIRLVGETNVTLQEPNDPTTSFPVVSYAVTKAFLSDRLNRANRIRAFNLIATGTGQLLTSLVIPDNSYGDYEFTADVTSINESSPFVGEPMLNARYNFFSSSGDNANVRVRLSGISESWQLAIRFSSNLRIAGIQFDTSRKSLRRLR